MVILPTKKADLGLFTLLHLTVITDLLACEVKGLTYILLVMESYEETEGLKKMPSFWAIMPAPTKDKEEGS